MEEKSRCYPLSSSSSFSRLDHDLVGFFFQTDPKLEGTAFFSWIIDTKSRQNVTPKNGGLPRLVIHLVLSFPFFRLSSLNWGVEQRRRRIITAAQKMHCHPFSFSQLGQEGDFFIFFSKYHPLFIYQPISTSLHCLPFPYSGKLSQPSAAPVQSRQLADLGSYCFE